MTVAGTKRPPLVGAALTAPEAATLPAPDVLARLGTSAQGLGQGEAAERLGLYGPNSVSTHRARLLPVLWRQLRSPLLGLLLVAATASYFLGQQTDALIIGLIVGLSVGLGLVNEYRAEKAAVRLHSQIAHRATVVRGGRVTVVDVMTLVPGDLVDLRLGDVVPADLRLTSVTGLVCDESILTGESQPVEKETGEVTAGASLGDLVGCALMGTVVQAGGGRGVVVSTGRSTEFGAIAAGLGTRQLETQFQIGLRRFSMLLVYVGGALTTVIFAINVALHRPILQALLFSLAIAVGITPQLLPAVVSSSLAAGSRRMSRLKVLVKRLVCIEDLGDVDVLFTDKTGTLTSGQIEYARSIPSGATPGDAVMAWGLLCTEAQIDEGGLSQTANQLDHALWSAAEPGQRQGATGWSRLSTLAFDHDRRLVSVLVRDPGGRTVMVTKGAPEAVLDRCRHVPTSARAQLTAEFAAGNRVVAVATRDAVDDRPLTTADESDLVLAGYLVFLDPPKADAAAALSRLRALGIDVKIVTGDSAMVAESVCHQLGLTVAGALTGTDLDRLDDEQLSVAIPTTTIFARVSPEHKARIVRCQRQAGGGVAFLGDGVNDALALHAADVGISVDSAADVAKDAAEVILLDKDLHVLADGVAEGRRIFANTIKYVLMGTSSNFGNMASAAGASLFLPFLPMLPSQILLNNLLYDASQLAIPTDHVDEEQLRRPSHWDIAFIRRFMFCFGPVSSVFDFVTFGVMLWVFNSGPEQFRTGWFVESLATQTLVIFVIRTRRTPFFRSRPSVPLALAAFGVVTVGAVLPATPLARVLGFSPLPAMFFVALAGMVVAYLALIETGKKIFYAVVAPPTVPVVQHRPGAHQRRRAAYFTNASRRGGTPSGSRLRSRRARRRPARRPT